MRVTRTAEEIRKDKENQITIIDKGALIEGNYRYSLWRIWDTSKKLLVFFMLNPSTADENKDDPIIRRCIKFAQYWGFGGIKVINLFAYRSSDPKILQIAGNPVGPKNPEYITEICKDPTVGAIIAAWGARGYNLEDHADELNRIKEITNGRTLFCLEITKDRYPKHPLYCRADLLPQVFLPSTNNHLMNGRCEHFDGGCCYGPWGTFFGEGCMLSNNCDCIHYKELDTKRHLCDSCTYEYPVCPAEGNAMEFGDGVGNDNIIKCQEWKSNG